MNFFQPFVDNPNATVETLEKQRVAWNKGLAFQTAEQKQKQAKIGRKVMSDPVRRNLKSIQMRELASRPEAREWRQRGNKNRHSVMTPYGQYPSALAAAKELGPRLGLKPCTIQAYIMRDSEKYSEWYYV